MHWLAWTIVIGAYLTVGLFAAYMTTREHQTNKNRNTALIWASYFLCLVWPLAVPAMFVFALWRPAEFTRAERDC